MGAFLVPLAAAILPFVLWLVELVLPFPAVVEELAKAGLVLAVSRWQRWTGLGVIVAAGIVFSFSETVLYSFNLLTVGDSSTFLTRLLLTTSLHTGTMVIMWLFVQFDRRLIVLGFIVAVALHAWYNAAVGLIR